MRTPRAYTALLGRTIKPIKPIKQASRFRPIEQVKRSDLYEAVLQERAAKRQGATGALVADLRYLERRQRKVPGQKVVSAVELQSIRHVLVRGEEHTFIASKEKQWEMAKKELSMILHCGYSRGVEDSHERAGQASELWKNLAKDEPGTPNEAFVRWVSKVREGESYYFSSAEVVDCIIDIPNLLCCFLRDNQLPEGTIRLDPKILNDMGLMRVASRQICDWLDHLRFNGTLDSKMSGSSAIMAVEPHWYIHIESIDPSLAKSIGKKRSTCRPFDKILGPSHSLSGTEVTITPHKMPHKMGQRSSQIRHGFRWLDSRGELCEVENLILPSGVMPATASEKRFIYFDQAGIDIRDEDGKSLGLRETTRPSSSGTSTVTALSQSDRRPRRPATLPLSSLVISLNNQRNGEAFLSLWEKQTGLKIDDVLSTPAVLGSSPSNAMMYPSWFFNTNTTQRALPTMIATIKSTHRNQIRDMLPAQPGDMLWLVDRFFEQYFPSGGEVDFLDPEYAAASQNAVWPRLVTFCNSPEYCQHPHLRVLKALTDFSSKNSYERQGATSTIIACIEVLRTPYSSQIKSIKHTAGSRAGIWTSRTIVTIGSQRPNGAVANVPLPSLVPFQSEIQISDDVPDAEEDQSIEQAGSAPLQSGEEGGPSEHRLSKRSRPE